MVVAGVGEGGLVRVGIDSCACRRGRKACTREMGSRTCLASVFDHCDFSSAEIGRTICES